MERSEMDKIIINGVKKFPYLYDKKELCFKDSKMKENTWKLIGQKIGMSGDECYKRFKCLRDSYVRKKKASGSDSQPALDPILASMTFIDENVRWRRPRWDLLQSESQPPISHQPDSDPELVVVKVEPQEVNPAIDTPEASYLYAPYLEEEAESPEVMASTSRWPSPALTNHAPNTSRPPQGKRKRDDQELKELVKEFTTSMVQAIQCRPKATSPSRMLYFLHVMSRAMELEGKMDLRESHEFKNRLDSFFLEEEELLNRKET